MNGQFERVESLALQPGERVELLTRVSVQARQGEEQRIQIVFNTNAPTQPMVGIAAIVPKVKGGARADPKVVAFGPLRHGTSVRQTIDLYDDGKSGRRVNSVRSTNPERFQVRLLELGPEDANQVSERAGKLIARAEVTALTDRIGSFDGNVEVSLANEDRPPDVVPVVGQVVRPVDCRPGELILPRRIGEKWVYSGRVLVFSRNQEPVTATVEKIPTGVRTKICSIADRPDQCWLEVECDPAGSNGARASAPARIQLRLASGSDETMVDLTVTLAEGSR